MNEQLIVKHIRTKNKVRKIVTYRENGELRQYHENVVKYLNEHTYNSIFAKAYAPHSSIYKNAQAHMYNDIFLKMDIKNFFPSLNHKYLAECLFYEINKNTTISRTECYDIVKKCSVGNKGIPLGLVSSPALANLYMKEFDGLLYGKIKRMDLINPIYTRYADDLVISFKVEEDYEQKIIEIQRIVKDLLKKVHLSINEKKTEFFNLEKSNHVRITGVSITKDENGYRHISVGKKLKNEIFWAAINQYDQKDRNDTEIAHIKGLFSFAMSIEKNGIEDCYSENMKALIKARGYHSLQELIKALGNE
ncbi:MAG: reverse transcriptase family protein [Lachnospiraceae bacterium]|nr:reverse transcriptase family protein [Lachnospiraceae bacterium]